ncbi:zinc finger MYM-type protein 1-like [Solenopsis invicta]|uniref:zinc finger MYM-type protein 1-like n=1 Tax=Solenopsis invicta TaxID=13686 RepID=UPI00193C9F2B|nr:zinc finger MYM-type protein 1-like [Solenopsis invicta]
MDTSLSGLLFKSIQYEQEVWKEILKRLLHVTLFLCERGLAFRGDSNRIGDLFNGNFLGLLELLAIYDPILNDHLRKVRHSQETGTRLQVHYLSSDIQNEFIDICAAEVINYILQEREKAKYFAIIVDATPDSAHIEQTVFLIRYVNLTDEAEGIYKIEERFLTFADCAQKTGEVITQLTVSKLEQFKIPLADCRGQGYDNGSNMKGAHKGVQAKILAVNNLVIYSACACHSINLCGVHAAESCSAALTFFGVIQKLYNLFSSSPQRWEILQKKIGHSLHSTSKTRWSARIESVKPFAAHLPGIAEALNELSHLNLSAESQRDVNGLKNYVRTFKCLVMSSIWVKILKPIDIVNKIIQARGATVDVTCKNLSSLIAELKALRDEGWENILNEAVIVAKNIGWPESFQEETKRGRKRRKMADEEEDEDDGAGQVTADVTFKREVFYVILDQVIEDLTERFKSMQELCENFSVLWKMRSMLKDEIEKRATNLVRKYSIDLQYELVNEAEDLKTIYVANFGEETLQPLELLNALQKMNLACLFPNLCIALRIFLTIPATVASAERSFSTLKRVKSVLRSTMSQDRLSSLGVLAVEAELARQVNMESLINDFASKKARKCNI